MPRPANTQWIAFDEAIPSQLEPGTMLPAEIILYHIDQHGSASHWEFLNLSGEVCMRRWMFNDPALALNAEATSV